MIYEEVVVLDDTFESAISRVKEAFAEQGFGTLTEIDFQATLLAKIGKEIPAYTILGVCNPGLAGRALDAEEQIGVLLPCNVVVRESHGQVIVEVMDPGLMASMTGNPDIEPIANDARARVSDALVSLGTVPAS